MYRYTFTVYQCKHTGVDGLLGLWVLDDVPYKHTGAGLSVTATACTEPSENQLAVVQKNLTTIASTAGKSSITAGCDAHRA